MTNLNNPLTRAQPSAPSRTLSVPAQMDEFAPGQNASDLGTDLQRLQRNVSQPLNALLDYTNGLGTPVTFSVSGSSIAANGTWAVYSLPIAARSCITSVAVVALGSVSGTANVLVGTLTCPVKNVLSAVTPPVPQPAVNAIPVYVTTNAAWSFTGTIYVTIYLRQL